MGDGEDTTSTEDGTAATADTVTEMDTITVTVSLIGGTGAVT